MTEIHVRKMTIGDVPHIVEAAERFSDESNFRGKVTPDRNKYGSRLLWGMDQPYVQSFTGLYKPAGGDWTLGGYIHIYAQNEASVEMIGEMYQFYTVPEARGTGLARALVKAAVTQYREWNCVRAYADAGPGMSDPHHLQLFANLFAKFGFEPVGRTFMMEFDHGKCTRPPADAADCDSAGADDRAAEAAGADAGPG